MAVSVHKVDKKLNEISFVSDAGLLSDQLADLRDVSNEQFYTDAAKTELTMASPGVTDQRLRYIDPATGEVHFGRLRGPQEGEAPQLLPVLQIAFDSLH